MMSLKPKVGLVRGDNRTENIQRVLRLIEGDIDLSNKSNIFIKVNFVSSQNQLAATHVDAVRPLLEFVRQRYDGKITIGESAEVPAWAPYRDYGYDGLVKDFNVQLVDLSEGEWIPVDLYDSSLQTMRLRYSKRVAESDYRIVIGPAKTHNVVVATLSIKNLEMGALYCQPFFEPGKVPKPDPNHRPDPTMLPPLFNTDKQKMHQGHAVHNLNLYLLARAYPPHLSIIDGFLGMDGDGPVDGDPVPWGAAIASRDAVAADSLAAYLMGFPDTDIGYLWYAARKGLGVGDINQMEILGAGLQECYCRFTPPPDYEVQKRWRDKRIEALLGLEK